MKHCKVDSCSSSVRARGLCGKHYERMRRHGSTEDVRNHGEKVPGAPLSWRRFGADGEWSTDLTESEHLATLGH